MMLLLEILLLKQTSDYLISSTKSDLFLITYRIYPNLLNEFIFILEGPLDSMEMKPVLKEINPECLLERLMLKLQYFGHLMQRPDSLEKTLMMGKIEGKRRMTEDEKM